MTKALDYLAEHDPSLACVQRCELRLAEDLGLGGAEGATAPEVARSLEHAIHRHLPVQRRQVLDWIGQHSASG